MGKTGIWLQNANQEIELLQHDLDDSFEEIDKLHQQQKEDNCWLHKRMHK